MLGSYFLIVPLNFTLCYIGATPLNIFTKLITSPIIRLVSRRTNKQDNLNNQINTPEKRNCYRLTGDYNAQHMESMAWL